jgi:hypothetical protein
MAEDYAPPSTDPADNGTLTGVLRAVLSKFVMNNLDDCLPCRVVAVDGRRFATVQPMVMMGTTEGAKVSRAQVPRVPILQLGAGGFVLSFPVKEGDLGWLKASDRDISLFMQGLEEEWPNTTRLHSFQDGFFIPDRMRDWTLDGSDADRLVIQAAEGGAVIAVGETTISIRATGPVEVEAESVAITADTVTVTSDNVTVNGSEATFTGHVSVGSLTIDGEAFTAHKHLGVTTGGGQTGGVAP